MKTKGKAWHLIATVLLIVVFVYTAFFGVYAKYGDTTTTYIKGAKDIRFGVDIKGGVNVTFVPSDGYDATEEQLEAAQLVIENRLVALNVTDYELYVDNNSDSLILEFPWQSGETDFDPEAAIDEIGTTAYLTFREGSSADGELILDGSMIESAAAQYGPVSNGGASEYFVSLKFTDDGAKAFGDATTKLAASGGTISIWLDDENVSTATVNPSIFTRAAKLEGKLVPVVKLVTVPSVYMVHPSMGVKDFQGFMAKVKAKPGDYSVGVPGLGTLGHLMMASFNETLKTDIQIVPYRGNGPALNDALAGMVQVMADQLPSAMPHIKGGKLVPMVLAADRRVSELPDVPTFKELGHADLNELGMSWFGLVVPAGTPAPIIKRLQDAAVSALRSPDVQGRLKTLGATAVEMDQSKFASQIAADLQRNKALLDKLGVKPE